MRGSNASRLLNPPASAKGKNSHSSLIAGELVPGGPFNPTARYQCLWRRVLLSPSRISDRSMARTLIAQGAEIGACSAIKTAVRICPPY